MKCTGAQILLESLVESGVDTVFGYPGGQVLFIYDELYKMGGRIRHVLVSHEQHAAHAADGYARSTGRVGVCLATSGPGATNLVTGIATAYMDSVPLVAITGNVSTGLLGKDSFQEVDIAGITMPVVKHNWIVRDVSSLAEVIREAFIVARTGRPGPVLIDIPKDVTSAEAEYVVGNGAVMYAAGSERAARLLERSRRSTFTEADIEKAASLLAASSRPVIYAGGGVIAAGVHEELRELAERLGSPVALSLMALGALSPGHPLYTGMIGMHGTVASNKAVQQADLLVAVGSRFSDRVTSRAEEFAPGARVLQFDIDGAEVNKNIATDFAVTGDLGEILRAVLKALPASCGGERAGWAEMVAKWKQRVPPAYTRKAALHPRFIVESVAAKAGDAAIVVTDVGQHQMWTAQFFPFTRPRQFLTSGGLGTMGFGLGAAVGAQVANPGVPVVLFTGDGSFRMNCAEMSTLAAYKLPVLIVVLNNGVLGMVRQWQTLFYGERYSETTLDRPPDFVKLAASYGLAGFSAASEEAFAISLDHALAETAAGRPALIDAHISMDEMVFPMVPGGKPIDEQIL